MIQAGRRDRGHPASRDHTVAEAVLGVGLLFREADLALGAPTWFAGPTVEDEGHAGLEAPRDGATPEAMRMKAPIRQASVDVSPMEPGMVPINACMKVVVPARACMPSAATSPSGVAAVKPSTAVHMASPVISAG